MNAEVFYHATREVISSGAAACKLAAIWMGHQVAQNFSDVIIPSLQKIWSASQSAWLNLQNALPIHLRLPAIIATLVTLSFTTYQLVKSEKDSNMMTALKLASVFMSTIGILAVAVNFTP